jgi:threonine dehydratase
VLAFSSGNHAQAVALAGKLLGIKTVIVMPADAPKVKLEGTRSHGAEVITYQKHENREQVTAKIAAERNLPVIPPYNHPHVIAGQGTTAKELIEETGPLDALLVPCGGAGLLSGCSIAAKKLSPGCRVIGVEPAAGDDVTQSFKLKKIISIPVPETIADGARTQAPGDLTFPLVLQNVDAMLTVSDDELLRAMFYLWEKLRTVVEPTGALAACALFEKKISLPGKRVGVVLSGGNVDLKWAAGILGSRS